jgi:hypothetical protein
MNLQGKNLSEIAVHSLNAGYSMDELQDYFCFHEVECTASELLLIQEEREVIKRLPHPVKGQ